MLGKRSAQAGLFEADTMYLDYVGKQTFYGFLAAEGDNLFPDEKFAGLYCPDNGRKSVPPSILAKALLLQCHDKVSDEEAVCRASFDLRWKVALRFEVDKKPFAKSTLQIFRSQLIIHDKVGDIFRESIEEAKRKKVMKGGKIKLAIDTTPIFGKGAVKDTYNLLADGIRNLGSVLAVCLEKSIEDLFAEQELMRYLAPSIKGTEEIDWDKEEERNAFLTSIIRDAQRLLFFARNLANSPEGGMYAQVITEAADLLCQLFVQDVQRKDKDTYKIKEGVARDRVPSVSDPEMRHGRKSSSNRFDGHKASIAVDVESQIIAAVEVIPGNAPDSTGALDLVKGAETNTSCDVEKAIGDCAYSGGSTRREFVDAGEVIIARVPGQNNRGEFSKGNFSINMDEKCVTCPMGQVTENFNAGPDNVIRKFVFDAATCILCPHYEECVRSQKKVGRTISINPEEVLLQAAKAFESTPEFREDVLLRQTVEHRIARLVQLGIRQSRFFGRQRTLYQVMMAAAVANLTLVLARVNEKGGEKAQDDLEALICTTLLVIFALWRLRKAKAASR